MIPTLDKDVAFHLEDCLVVFPDRVDLDCEFVRCKNVNYEDVDAFEKHIRSRILASRVACQKGLYDTAIMLRLPDHRIKHVIECWLTGKITSKRAWEIARETWINCSELYRTKLIWQRFFALNVPNSHLMMCEADQERLNQLPNRFNVYRGFFNKDGRRGISWTTSKMIASQYSVRGGMSLIMQGVVNKSDVIAYIGTRGHYEIIVKDQALVEIHRSMKVVTGEVAMRWIKDGHQEAL